MARLKVEKRAPQLGDVVQLKSGRLLVLIDASIHGGGENFFIHLPPVGERIPVSQVSPEAKYWSRADSGSVDDADPEAVVVFENLAGSIVATTVTNMGAGAQNRPEVILRGGLAYSFNRSGPPNNGRATYIYRQEKSESGDEYTVIG